MIKEYPKIDTRRIDSAMYQTNGRIEQKLEKKVQLAWKSSSWVCLNSRNQCQPEGSEGRKDYSIGFTFI